MSELKVLCPYCNEVWTAEMKEELESAEGCDTCGYGNEPTGNIDIICSHCGKLVYRKEIE